MDEPKVKKQPPVQTKSEPAQPAVQVKKPTNTLAIVGLILAIFGLLLPAVGLIVSIIALIQIKKNHDGGRGIAIAGIVIGSILLFLQVAVVIAAYANPHPAPYPDDKPAQTTQKTEEKPQKPAESAEKELSYEVLGESKSGTLNRVKVYTTETTDDRLIKLNDKLLAQYKPGLTHLYIDYFNDKTAATDYFNKQSNPNISEAEKDQLYTHYIANMVYNTTSGLKQLVRQGDTQKVLKNY